MLCKTTTTKTLPIFSQNIQEMSAEEDCFVTDAAAKHERLKTGSFIYGCTRVTFKRLAINVNKFKVY